EKQPSNVSTGSSEAFDVTASERVEVNGDHHYWARTSCGDCSSQSFLRPRSHHYVYASVGDFLICSAVPGDVWGLHKFESKILTFIISKFGHTLYEGQKERDAPGLHAGSTHPQRRALLRTRAERPHGASTSNECDEFSPPHGIFPLAENRVSLIRS